MSGDGRVRTGRRAPARRPAFALALVLALLGTLAACGDTGDSGPGRAALQGVLARQAAAVRDGDERGYLATVDPEAAAHRTAQRQVFRNLQRLPLAEWSYEVTGVSGGAEHATARVRLRYRLKEYDRVATTATERYGFVRRDGAWWLTSERSGSTRQLWDLGRLRVVRGEHSLVTGVGRSRAELRELAAAADRAVPAVGKSWPKAWSRKLVLEAPGSPADMARLLKAPASAYEGIAAVTTGEAGGDDRDAAPADRIVINPRAYGMLSGTGRQVVLTHEATHVATRDRTTPATPLWLSEGFADWAGYRDSGQRPREAAPELTRAVADDAAGTGGEDAGGVLGALPTDKAFRFGNDPVELARAYEGGWLACRMVAERWGEDRLIALYVSAGEQHDRKAPDLEAALRDVLHIGEREFTARWRDYVRAELGG